jgi:CDP-diacylglycerol---glycerol-3-phosphate 3-phosphatidyltransferase
LFNIPNILAFIRLLIAPVMFWIILNPQLFTECGMGYQLELLHRNIAVCYRQYVTDFFDGYVARELDQITIVGEILDPLADKMLTLAAFLGLMMSGAASAWAIYIIIVRELFITGLRTLSVSEGINVSASMAGKVKTVAQMIAIGFLLMHWPFGDVLLWIAVALTVYSGARIPRWFCQSL